MNWQDDPLHTLMRRYDVPAPRYTSYPTALHFDETVGAAELRAEMERDRDSGRPVSLYAHIPFCNSLCWYCACSRVIARDTTRGDRYLDRLFVEMDTASKLLSGRPVVELHLGGGTPTFLTPDQLARLATGVRERFDIADDSAWSIEIDPRAANGEHVDVLWENGFRRASLGVQDNDPDVQRAIHRIQPFEQTRSLVEDLRGHGMTSVNFDLIYGLPRQTSETFSRTLDDVLEVMPERLAVYSYAHVPWVQPAQRLLERHPRPTADEKLQLLRMTIERLTSAGYVYIGMDHFALPHDPLAIALRDGTLRRNFQGYSLRDGVDIQAFGVTSISQTRGLYVQNEKELDAWEAVLEQTDDRPIARGVALTDDDQIRRAFIMGIMCQNAIDFDAFEETWGVSPRDYFATGFERLESLADDGLVEVTPGALHITGLGRLFLRNIALTMDGRIDPDEERYSRAV